MYYLKCPTQSNAEILAQILELPIREQLEIFSTLQKNHAGNKHISHCKYHIFHYDGQIVFFDLIQCKFGRNECILPVHRKIVEYILCNT